MTTSYHRFAKPCDDAVTQAMTGELLQQQCKKRRDDEDEEEDPRQDIKPVDPRGHVKMPQIGQVWRHNAWTRTFVVIDSIDITGVHIRTINSGRPMPRRKTRVSFMMLYTFVRDKE